MKTIYYSFDNYENGEKLRLIEKDNKYSIAYKKDSKTKKVEFDDFKWQKNQIIGKALHELIDKNWKKIIAEKEIDFDMLVPSRGETFQFQILRKKDLEKNKKGIAILLQHQSFLLRSFVPKILFYYEEHAGVVRAIEYEGPSAILIENDPDRKIRIKFSYPKK